MLDEIQEEEMLKQTMAPHPVPDGDLLQVAFAREYKATSPTIDVKKEFDSTFGLAQCPRQLSSGQETRQDYEGKQVGPELVVKEDNTEVVEEFILAPTLILGSQEQEVKTVVIDAKSERQEIVAVSKPVREESPTVIAKKRQRQAAKQVSNASVDRFVRDLFVLADIKS